MVNCEPSFVTMRTTERFVIMMKLKIITFWFLTIGLHDREDLKKGEPGDPVQE